MTTELLSECRALADRAQLAARRLATVKGAEKSDWLKRSAEAMTRRAGFWVERRGDRPAYAQRQTA